MKELATIIAVNVCAAAFFIFVGYVAAENKVYRGCRDTQSVELFGYEINCSVRTSSYGYPIDRADK